MEKLINKILNNYYKKQLVYKIKNLMCFYAKGLDYKFVESKEGFELQVKKHEYKDDLYAEIAYFDENEYLSCLINWKELSTRIKKYIEEYEKIKY